MGVAEWVPLAFNQEITMVAPLLGVPGSFLCDCLGTDQTEALVLFSPSVDVFPIGGTFRLKRALHFPYGIPVTPDHA